MTTLGTQVGVTSESRSALIAALMTRARGRVFVARQNGVAVERPTARREQIPVVGEVVDVDGFLGDEGVEAIFVHDGVGAFFVEQHGASDPGAERFLVVRPTRGCGRRR